MVCKKLSKRQKHEIDKKRRGEWGTLNPVTRFGTNILAELKPSAILSFF